MYAELLITDRRIDKKLFDNKLYLSVDVSNMNYGKQKETHDRVEHTGIKII